MTAHELKLAAQQAAPYLTRYTPTLMLPIGISVAGSKIRPFRVQLTRGRMTIQGGQFATLAEAIVAADALKLANPRLKRAKKLTDGN